MAEKRGPKPTTQKIAALESSIGEINSAIAGIAEAVKSIKPADTSNLEQGLAAIGARLDATEQRLSKAEMVQTQAKDGPKTLADREGDDKTSVVNKGGFREMSTDQYHNGRGRKGDHMPRGPVLMDREGNSLDQNRWKHVGEFWVEYDPDRTGEDGQPLAVRKIPYYTPDKMQKASAQWDTGYEPAAKHDFQNQKNRDVPGSTMVEGPGQVRSEYDEESEYDARMAQMN